MDSVQQFYNELAANYHLIFADWRQAVRRQGEVLDGIIQAQTKTPPGSLLDCACGIGTQAIGLALRGYRVHATDFSPAAVERAFREAESFGVSITFGVADMRTLAEQVRDTFEVVIACDNSLPHLLSDEDLLLASRGVGARLQPGGVFLATIRDYDRLVIEKPRVLTPRVYDEAPGRRISFQMWDWAENGRTYTVNQFLVKESGDSWQTEHYATTYRVLLRDELSQILRKAGFTNISWHMPAASGYYQPVVTASKP